LKYLVLLGDGMADFPVDELGNRTALEAARCPAMDQAAQEGICGLYKPIPDHLPAGSDIGNLSVFGYNPDECFTGRAPLEAVNQGIALADDQLAFRCNLVTLDTDHMRDFTAGHISSEEAAELMEYLNREMGGDDCRFVAGVGYRHLCLVTPSASEFDALADLSCTPPHDITNQVYAPHLPQGPQASYIVDMIHRAQQLLPDHPVNQKRVSDGKPPANSIWLWGQGKAPNMTTYAERYGLTGAVISAVDLVNGIGRAAGLEVVHVPGATGYLDTDYEGKVRGALEALDRLDFVYLHVEAPDETAHEGRADLKVQAIEDFDGRVVAPCLEYGRKQGDLRVVIAPDHITSIAGGPVPFVLWGQDIAPNGVDSYTEAAAAHAGVLYPKGHDLVPSMFNQSPLPGAH
jgi:2,3-bisphosphoglycerate-independent phosphoglycerate mutase